MPATSMNVQLLTMTPDAGALIYAACKQCTSPDDAADVFRAASDISFAPDGFPFETKNKLIRRVIDSGHLSVLEHVQFSFAISGVSRALSHQLVRHRIASYSQQSQRYVKADDFEYVVPPSISSNPASELMFCYAMELLSESYGSLTERGIPPEDARFVLPNASATKIVVTMNCRALLHFFEERCCNRAQWEIRALAKAMLNICKDKLPVVFANSGPKCKRLGRCPEAKPCTPTLEDM